MRNVIVFKVITELSDCKYLYRSTIENCLLSVCYKTGVSIPDEERESIISEVEEAFSSLV